MKSSATGRILTAEQRNSLFALLEERFAKNIFRHQAVDWEELRAKLEADPAKLWSLWEMEDTGGEPDVIRHDPETGKYLFMDCCAEAPKGRVSLCYDREGYNSRKEHHPKDTVIDRAEAMGIEVLTESQYSELQSLGEFDKKTSCWVKTPEGIRKLGGALYCELRYGRVFTGHNGAQSYYGSRGFRGSLEI